MDAAEQVKRGRPKKQDVPTPLGAFRKEEAKKERVRKSENKIVQKYYELHGTKLSLCKKKNNGNLYRVFVGSTDDKKSGAQIREFVKKLEKEKNLRIKV